MAARRSFVEFGYERTSLDALIAEVGGSRRNIYRAYGSKRGLFHAVMEQIIGEIAGSGESAAAEGVRPRDWLISCGIDFVSRMVAPDTIAVFRQLIAMHDMDAEQTDRLWQNGPERFRNGLADWFRQQNERGALTIEDPDIAATLLPDMMRGSLQIELLSGLRQSVSKEEVETQVTRAVDFFLKAASSEQI